MLWQGSRWFHQRRSAGRLPRRRLVLGHVIQKCRRWHEEQVSSDGTAEVEQAIVIAGRPANEHVLEHLLDSAWRTAVADEIGTKLTLRGPAKRHVVSQDLDLFPVLNNRGECAVRRARLDGSVQFDVRKLLPADDSLLRLSRQRIPSLQIVKI